ncbi:hypothetical protein LTR84_009400 [Exophiala bonariae]|uniref:Uncharacterized protein n=1 Tax=Exophiala bonariae TaxID=1690606 RepID=A0AAV9MXJ1_9EURO|nr:hypothetical protein LTR84_009400 [Exophiala bonariae]
MVAEQRKQQEADPDTRKGYNFTDIDIYVYSVVGMISVEKGTTLQAVSTYVVPIVDIQTVKHVKAMAEALRIIISKDEIATIQSAYTFDPLFAMNFLFNHNNIQPYGLSLTAANVQQYQMAARSNALLKLAPYQARIPEPPR